MPRYGMTQARLRAIESIGELRERLRALEGRLAAMERKVEDLGKRLGDVRDPGDASRHVDRLARSIEALAERVGNLERDSGPRKASVKKKATESAKKQSTERTKHQPAGGVSKASKADRDDTGGRT